VDYNDVDAYWYHIKSQSVIHEEVGMFIPKRDKYAWKKKKT